MQYKPLWSKLDNSEVKMRQTTFIVTGFMCLFSFWSLSCARSTNILPILPSQPSQSTDPQNQPVNSHQLWGYFNIFVDPSSNSNEVVPLRLASDHWNVLKFLDNGPCTNCVKITGITDSDHDTKLVTVSVKHPFPSPNLTGFDVRGIAMFTGSHLFPTSGLTISDKSLGQPELINADGFTTLYNIITIGKGPGGLQGYHKGKFATQNMPDTKLNGFKRFESAGAANTRSAFYAGQTITKVYDIDMPHQAFFLGYAVDASWAPPINKPVTDPMADFPQLANCYEPYCINVKMNDNTLTDKAGFVDLTITVLDHQGSGSHLQPVLECPEVITSFAISETSPGVYHAYFSNKKNAVPGEYKLLISVEDSMNSGSPAWIDLTAYQIISFKVEKDQGWARTFGGAGDDQGNAVTADSFGNVYVTGNFKGTVDFDPGPDTWIMTSNADSQDAFVSMFDPQGNLIWAKAWGGPGTENAEDIFFNKEIYVVGSFEGTTDFNPGSAVNNQFSKGGSDAYATCLDMDGKYLWATSWGGTKDDQAFSVTYDFSNLRIMVTGYFQDSVTFPGGQSATSKGGMDIFLVDVAEGHNMLGTYGGTDNDVGVGLARNITGTVLLTGGFSSDVNFNPGGFGGGRHSAGSTDAFLAEYDLASGDKPANQAINTWGAGGADQGNAVCVHTFDIYVTGFFCGSVDFNPGSGTDILASAGSGDGYVCHYTTAWTYKGATQFGWNDVFARDSGQEITVDGSGNVYVAGNIYVGDIFVTHWDAFVASYDPDLNKQWSDVFSSGDSEYCYGICTDQWDRIYVTGGFPYMLDFDPASGSDDMHTSNGWLDCFLLKLYSNGQW
jgi:hypothetical protein